MFCLHEMSLKEKRPKHSDSLCVMKDATNSKILSSEMPKTESLK